MTEIRRGNPVIAAPLLKELSESYPQSQELSGWLALADLKTGSVESGVTRLRTLNAKSLSADLNKALDTFFALKSRKKGTI